MKRIDYVSAKILSQEIAVSAACSYWADGWPGDTTAGAAMLHIDRMQSALAELAGIMGYTLVRAEIAKQEQAQ